MKKIFILLIFINMLLSVAYSQVNLTINVNNAGQLSSLLTANQKSTVTNLKVTGNIDARDFKVMRDDMPLLSVVDLSGSTIKAYSGTAGTYKYNTNYADNQIPERSFCYESGYGKTTITAVALPPSITSIGKFAFRDTKGLVTVTIPASVSSIATNAFLETPAILNVESGNQYYSSLDGVLFNKDKTLLIQAPTSKTGSYSIPSTVLTIGESAFSRCDKITAIVFNNSLVTIEEYAFHICYGLTSINLPSMLETIKANGFYNCEGLKSISIPASVKTIGRSAFTLTTGNVTVDPGNQYFSSADGVLYNKDKTVLIHYPLDKNGSFIIPNTVTEIGTEAFYSCENLTGITLPAGLKIIHERAFMFCEKLPSVDLPKGITTIGFQAFEQCYALTSFVFPEGIQEINHNVLYYNTGLKSITLPSSITFIGNQAFASCSKLTSLTVNKISPVDMTDDDSRDAFQYIPKDKCTLFVPFGSKAAYSKAFQWKDFTSITEMTGMFPSTYSVKFNHSNGTKKIYFASSVAWTAVSDQSWLKINPASKSTSDSVSFTVEANTGALRTAKVTFSSAGLPDKIIEVDQYGFAHYTVTAGEVKNTIGSSLSEISKLKLSGTIDARDFKTIRDDMLFLTEVDLSNAVVVSYSGTEGTYGNEQYDYAANQLPLDAFGDYSYPPKNKFKSIILPLSITSIDHSSFYNCGGLTSLSIPPSVVYLGDYLFYGCDNLVSLITYSVKPITLDVYSSAFDGLDKTKCTLYVPYGSKALYQAAKHWKDFVNIVEMPGVYPSETSLLFGGSAETKVISVASSVSWTSQSDNSWLTINPASGGAGNTQVSIIVSKNPNEGSRKAKATFKANGFDDKNIEVTQFSAVNVVAGELKNVLGSQIGAMTSLKLIGTIDARDFKTMRDDMPSLTEIDLSEVSILSYKGAEGTSPWSTSSSSYSANSIPSYSFNNIMTNGRESKLESIILPGSITSISTEAFYYCDKLKSITIPASVSTIGNEVFMNCHSMSSATIPASVISIGEKAFANNPCFITVEAENMLYCSADGVLFNKDKTRLLHCPASLTGNYIVPSSVTLIGDFAFYNCSLITSLTLPDNLESMTLSSLTDCSGLTTLTIPATVKFIGHYVLQGCYNITSLNIKGAVPVDLTQMYGVFTGINTQTCKLNVPYGTGTAYRNAEQWKDFQNIIESGTGFSINARSLSMPATEGEISVNVKANIQWSVTSNENWLTFAPASGSGNGSFKIKATANPGYSRFARVIVSSSGQSNQIIDVVQSSGLSALVLAAKNDGSEPVICERFTNIITGNQWGYFMIKPAQSGLYTFSTISGTDTYGILYDNSYKLLNSRDNFMFDDFEFSYYLYQDKHYYFVIRNYDGSNIEVIMNISGGNLLEMWVDKTQIAFPSKESSDTITINASSNSVWTVSSDQAWLTSSVNTGTGIGEIILTATENVTTAARIAYVTITSTDQSKQVITVTQYTGDAFISVSSDYVLISSVSGSEASIAITSNVNWVAVSDQSWLVVTPESGAGNGTLTFTATENNSGERTCNVTITAQGLPPIVVVVAQEAGNTNWFDMIASTEFKPFIQPALVENSFNIKGVEGEFIVTVYDINGKKIFARKVIANESISAAKLKEGLYIIDVERNDKRALIKMIKK
jgi:hypothetical protein